MTETKGFNPNQPRDPHGRFGEVASLAANAISGIVAASGNAAHVASAIASALVTNKLPGFRAITENLAEEMDQLIRKSGAHKISDHLKEILNHYSEDSEINNGLRKGNPVFGDSVITYALDKAMQQSHLPENLVLYRGIRGELTSQHQPGAVIHDLGYMSTSLSEWTAEAFAGQFNDPGIIHILARKGKSAIPMGEVSNHPEEDEILLPRGSKYKVLHREGKKIYAELL